MQVQNFLKHPQVRNIGMIAIAAILIWLIGPHIHMGGSTPFAAPNVRGLLIGLLFGSYAIKMAFNFVMRHKTQAWPIIKSGCSRGWQKTKYVCMNLGSFTRSNVKGFRGRVHQDKYRRALKRLPWYLVVGGQQAGKKTLVSNSSMHFLAPDQFGRQAEMLLEQFPNYQWWLTDQAVLIDMAEMTDEEESQSEFKRFIRMLKRIRKNKPLSGIVLTISVTDLLTLPQQGRQKLIEETAEKARDLYHSLKAKLPVYVVFNKCDLISGFIEFFNDLSKEDLGQVWGVTLPLDSSTSVSKSLQFINNEYNQLMARLQQRVLWSMDSEKNAASRELIHTFLNKCNY